MEGKMELISLDQILPNPDQPRKNFDAEGLEELKRSIKINGVLQPIVVEAATGGMFILHDGERRVRAARLAGFSEIPAMILPESNGKGNETRLLHSMVANLQRKDLNPVEEAQAYKKLHDMGLTVREISKMLGINEIRISNCMIILKLEEPIQQLIRHGKFSSNSAVVNSLLKIPDPNARIILCEKLAMRGLGKSNVALANSIEMLNKKLEGKLPYKDSQVPSIKLAQKSKPVDLPKWDILYQAGKVPSWGVIYKAAMNTCNACPLRPAASDKTCQKCSAAIMLREVIDLGIREKARLMANKVMQKRQHVRRS